MNNDTLTETRDVYSIVTEQIIAQLEKGIVPWQKPWSSAGYPKNLLNGTYYKGINLLLLNSLPYHDNYFLTWEQLKKVGASVNKGEVGHMVVFWKMIEKETAEGKKEPRQYLRYHKVFNVAQLNNLSNELWSKIIAPEKVNDPIATCEKVIAEMQNPPTFNLKGKEAWYSPARDLLEMPPLKRFTDSESYYATKFHELIHSTGHKSRLDRFDGTDNFIFGSTSYSIEELIAEIGTCFLQSYCGILNAKQIENNSAYIGNWLQKLRDDRKFIVSAAVKAQRAVDFILGIPKTQKPD